MDYGTPYIFKNCELKYDGEYTTAYQGRDGDMSYTIEIDKMAIPEDKQGTVYISMLNDKDEWEEYDFFWFYQDKMIVE